MEGMTVLDTYTKLYNTNFVFGKIICGFVIGFIIVMVLSSLFAIFSDGMLYWVYLLISISIGIIVGSAFVVFTVVPDIKSVEVYEIELNNDIDMNGFDKNYDILEQK